MNKLTIITTVYNRKEDLLKLYKSLVMQTNNTFCWLIVDDGSDDDLEKLVKTWMDNSVLKIFFLSQENSGKMAAYRKAISKIETKWSIVVDSDDWLDSDAVEIILKDISLIENNKTLIGSLYPKKNHLESENKKWNSIKEPAIDLIKLKYQFNINESAIVLRNDVLEEAFQNLLYLDEKFMSEEVLYNRLIAKGKFLVIKKSFYNYEYKADGLTKNIFDNWVANPKGTVKLLKSRYNAMGMLPLNKRLLGRVKTIINLNAFALLLHLNIWMITPSKLYSFLLYLPSLGFKKIRFKNG